MTSHNLPIPGTILLLDQSGVSGSEHLKGSSDVVLSPVPSNDVNDPLRWSWKRKQIAHACLVLYVITVGISCTALYSVLVPIEAATGIPLGTLNAGTGYMFLLLGWGGLITQPLALAYGKRGVYLVSQAATIGVVIWMAYIKTESAWLGNKVLQGFIASPIEMLIEDSIGDLFYAHERGFYIGVYAFALFGSNYVAPMFAGFVNDSLGYKWVFYVCAIIQSFGLVISFFFMEETNYIRRPSVANSPEFVPVDRTVSSTEKADIVAPAEVISVEEASPHSLTGTPHTYAERLLFFNKRYTPPSLLWTMMYRPILLLRFPVVFWAGFYYGASLTAYSLLNATTSLIFSSPPYNFQASMVGLTYIGPLIGVFASGIYSGWLADKYMLRITGQKKGIREPEDRLWMLFICAILCPVAFILWGVGASAGIHWVGLVFGGGILAFCSAVAAGFTINYAIDAYKELSGEVLISIMLVRNSLSFAVGYGVTPWLADLGLKYTFVTAAMVWMVVYASFYLVIRYGKTWRANSAEAYWKYAATTVIHH